MPCYKPLTAWRGVRDRQIYWRKINDCDEIRLACGSCIGCRLERSRQWAIRCIHESKMHKHNSFLTLTYNDENNPGTLNTRDPQLFLKRLDMMVKRKPSALYFNQEPARVQSNTAQQKRTWKYYLGAEYGDRTRRPHYHICLFGIDFADKQYLSKSPTGAKLYRSTTLEKLWPMGFSTIGQITFESAAYVARYVMKKITGDAATKHYQQIDKETGEIKTLKPEFNTMSRRPGLGQSWLNKYTPDVYPEGKVVIRNHKSNSPRYYDKLYKRLDPYAYQDLKTTRETEALGQHLEQTHERLATREAVAKAKINHLKRKL